MIKENGKIYKYTNKINGKIYIGQTTTSLKDRHKKHKSQMNDNTYFHKALRKYGEDNFILEVIEDNIALDRLDERERYWIDYYDSFYILGKGYNLTQGGKWSSGTQKLSIKQARVIQRLLRETEMSFREIGVLYNVSMYCISDINNGNTFVDTNIKYPIRQHVEKSIITDDVLNNVIDLLENTTLTESDIATMLNIKVYTVQQINCGHNAHCPSSITYPIRKSIKTSTYNNILNHEQVLNIIYDLCYSNKTLLQIGEYYGVSKNTINDISRGITWKEITNNLKCPIRKNKKENIVILEHTNGIV